MIDRRPRIRDGEGCWEGQAGQVRGRLLAETRNPLDLVLLKLFSLQHMVKLGNLAQPCVVSYADRW